MTEPTTTESLPSNKEDLIALIKLCTEQEQAWSDSKLLSYTPHNGKYSRDPNPPPGVYDGQEAFHRSNATVRIVVTGNRWGKTTASALEAFQIALGIHPHKKIPVPNRGKIYSESYSMLMETFAKKIDEWLPEKYLAKKRGRHLNNNGQLVGLNFANGSEIRFGTYDQSIAKAEGSNWHYVAFDEPPPRELYIANFRGIVDFAGIIWITATPLSEPWLFDDLWEPGLTGKKKYVQCFDGTMDDNIFVPPEIRKLYFDEMTPAEREVRFYGKFRKLEGLVIDTYDSFVHDVNPFKLGADFSIYEGIDPHPGKAHAVLWKAINERNERYVVRELKFDGGMAEFAREISLVREDLRSEGAEVVCSVSDTSLNQKDLHFKINQYDELRRYLRECGEHLMPQMAGKRDWLHAGIRKLRDLYRVVKDEKGESRVQQYVFKNCVEYKKELVHYQWPKKTVQGDEVKPIAKSNDLIDCDRYIETKAPRFETPAQSAAMMRTYNGAYQRQNPYQRTGRGNFYYAN